MTLHNSTENNWDVSWSHLYGIFHFFLFNGEEDVWVLTCHCNLANNASTLNHENFPVSLVSVLLLRTPALSDTPTCLLHHLISLPSCLKLISPNPEGYTLLVCHMIFLSVHSVQPVLLIETIFLFFTFSLWHFCAFTGLCCEYKDFPLEQWNKNRKFKKRV